jgi:hypothetical protein
VKGVSSTVMAVITIGLVAGSGVGAAAQGDGAAPRWPVEFSGSIECGPAIRAGTNERETTTVGDQQVVRDMSRGSVHRQSATMSDPRMAGTYYLSWDTDEVSVAGASGPLVGSATWRIVNEDGAWQGSFPHIVFLDDHASTVTTALSGEGAYAGLTAIVEGQHDWDACTWAVRGLIIEGDPPATPDPFVTP